MNEVEEGEADPGTRSILEVIGLTILAFLVAAVVGVVFIIQMVAIGYEVQTTLVLVGATGAGQLAMFALGYGYLRYRPSSRGHRGARLNSLVEFPADGDTDTDDAENERYRVVSFAEPPAEVDVPDHTNDCRDRSHVLKRS